MEKNNDNNTSFLKYFLGLVAVSIIIYFFYFYKGEKIEHPTTSLMASDIKADINNADIPKTVNLEDQPKEDHVVTSSVSTPISSETQNETPSPEINEETDYSFYADKNIIYSIEKAQYINRILISKTSNILMWHFLNGGLYQDYSVYKYNNAEGNRQYLNFSTSCYVFEILFRVLSFSYISKTNRRYGMYWKVHLFENYSGYHNFNEKCTRGLVGFYVGFYYNYIKTENFKIGFYIGIGTMIQRFYGLCFKNRVVNYSPDSNKAINKIQFYHNDSTNDPVLKTTRINKRRNQEPFSLLEILTNPLSYYNTDIIGDLGILNLEHKNGFCFNINWKLGVVNTYLILRKYKTSIASAKGSTKKNSGWTENPFWQTTKYFVIYNMSISCGFDFNKKI